MTFLISGGILALLAAGCFVYWRIMYPPVQRVGCGPKAIVCVGDSITYGLGVVGRRKSAAFPALVAAGMGAEHCSENYGLSDRTLQSTADKPYFREKLGKQAWDARGDILIFMLGSNDCKRKNWNAETFRTEYRAALQHYQASGFRKMVVMIPPRIFYTNAGKTGYDDAILKNELAPIVREAAQSFGIPCIDLYDLTRDHPEWFPDRLHPNAAGNRAIAEAILNTLRDA